MATSPAIPSTSGKKHRKHKSMKRDCSEEEKPGLKLILKVGSQTTPEHTTEYDCAAGGNYVEGQEGTVPMDTSDPFFAMSRSHHKKSKKKKKKKDKNKDRVRKHKHHHKDKKRKREEMEVSSAAEDSTNGGTLQNLGSPSSHRGMRKCVLRQRQERGPLSKMLEQLLALLEKKDPQNFFAWPVTDNIAPGYSSIITNPMDFCTMRQKIEEHQYSNLQEFSEDFKLICDNAMRYNHQGTVYYKASKKLLHAGTKLLQPDKLGWLINAIPDLTSEDVGFEITPEMRQHRPVQPCVSSQATAAAAAAGGVAHSEDEELQAGAATTGAGAAAGQPEAKRKMPPTKFEAVPDDLTPEEILARSQAAARLAKAKIMQKRVQMGFLKQRKDGTTNLSIIVPGEGGSVGTAAAGWPPGPKKRPVLLGQLTGRLSDGSSQVQGFREDRRNTAKPVKPLYYGAFGSYAPSYDSAFANLTKEESDLVYQTYGSDTAVQYAESVQDFVKDSDYSIHLVDSLLDLLTGGDHSRTKKLLDENKKLREEEEAVKTMLEVRPIDAVKVDVDELRSLQDVGIDVGFLETMDEEIRVSEERHEMQRRLDDVSQLLDRLQHTQNQRLSQPLPPSLHQLPQPSEEELQLADTITESLTEIAKKVSPGQVAPVPGLRKALNMPVPPPEPPVQVPSLPAVPQPVPQVPTRAAVPQVPSRATASPAATQVTSRTAVTPQVAPQPAATQATGQVPPQTAPQGDVPDLELELRQFLESEPALSHSPLRDDQTIEEILTMQ